MNTNTNLKAKRIAPGLYEYTTADGSAYEIHSWQRPEADHYGPAGETQWYWRPANGEAHDRFCTKREALEALHAHLEAAR